MKGEKQTLSVYEKSIDTLMPNLQNPEKDIAEKIYKDIVAWNTNWKNIYDDYAVAKPSK